MHSYINIALNAWLAQHIPSLQIVTDDDDRCKMEARLITTRKLAHELLVGYGLYDQGWQFAFDDAKMRCGCTRYHDFTITISRHYVTDPDVGDADIRNTILHEIAHAFAGYHEGHSDTWKKIALAIGCDGQRCNTVWTGAKPRYRVHCECGQVESHRHIVQRRVLSKKKCPECLTLFATSLRT